MISYYVQISVALNVRPTFTFETKEEQLTFMDACMRNRYEIRAGILSDEAGLIPSGAELGIKETKKRKAAEYRKLIEDEGAAADEK
jgi:hypothetical protein